MGFLSNLFPSKNGMSPNEDDKNMEKTADDISDNAKKDASPTGTETKSVFDKRRLCSGAPLDRYYAWNKYLVRILSNVEFDDTNTLKHCTIYIRKTNDCDYEWNDKNFKADLKDTLKHYHCAIGSSTLSIEVVSENAFQRIADKAIGDAQFKKRIDDVILFCSKKETIEQKFATVPDKRAFIIRELLNRFRSSTGTDSQLMENLTIIVVRNEDDNDMAQHDWDGERFKEDLRRELTNAYLGRIGRKSLQVVLKPISETDGCINLIENYVYYKWERIEIAKDDIPYRRVEASISIHNGNGSMRQDRYILDSDIKTTYHIGRGETVRRDGIFRTNDIVINDNETYVSGAQADIIFKNGKYYLRAASGGCRAGLGTSPTKIVRAENAIELSNTAILYPLEDGDILELGKKVLLRFSLSGDM